MNKSKSIVGALANKGSRTFRQTFQHSTNDVAHYFPGHMARGKKARVRDMRLQACDTVIRMTYLIVQKLVIGFVDP